MEVTTTHGASSDHRVDMSDSNITEKTMIFMKFSGKSHENRMILSRIH